MILGSKNFAKSKIIMENKGSMYDKILNDNLSLVKLIPGSDQNRIATEIIVKL